jgi:hypothetical protein
MIRLNDAIDFKDTGIEFLLQFLSMTTNEVDLKYAEKIFRIIKENDEHSVNLEDSLSPNQFKSKWPLIDAIESLNILNTDSTLVLWGAWYGSILIPYFQKKVAQIIGIDQDEKVVRLAINKLFYDMPNVDFIVDDIFATHRNIYKKTDLIINTSCEHMAPMNQWRWFQRDVFKEPQLSENCHFAFQSNNMEGIEGHVNCVSSLQEFKSQLPKGANILIEDQIEDERGIRFMLIGNFKAP